MSYQDITKNSGFTMVLLGFLSNKRRYKYTNPNIIQIWYKYDTNMIQIYKYTKIQIYKDTNIQIHKDTNIQRHKNTNTQIYEYTKIQIYKYKYDTNIIQIYQYTKIEIYKDTNK